MQLSAIQLDALREAANIGAGNAATRLANMLGKRVQMRIPEVNIQPIAHVAEMLGGAERPVAAVYVHVRGSASGNLLLFFPLNEARRLADLLVGHTPQPADGPLDALAQSALKELGNIFTGAFVSALSLLADVRLIYSVPGLAMDMLQAVLDGLLTPWASREDHALVLQTAYEVAGETVRGHVVFLPSTEGLAALLEALNVESLGGSQRRRKP